MLLQRLAVVRTLGKKVREQIAPDLLLDRSKHLHLIGVVCPLSVRNSPHDVHLRLPSLVPRRHRLRTLLLLSLPSLSSLSFTTHFFSFLPPPFFFPPPPLPPLL